MGGKPESDGAPEADSRSGGVRAPSGETPAESAKNKPAADPLASLEAPPSVPEPAKGSNGVAALSGASSIVRSFLNWAKETRSGRETVAGAVGPSGDVDPTLQEFEKYLMAHPVWEDEALTAAPQRTQRRSTGSTSSVINPGDPNRYRYAGEHARGGMGRIVIAHDRSFGREVALKELLKSKDEVEPPADLRERFLREAKITGRLEHPNIVPVHEIGERADGTCYYTMKFLRGRTMSQLLAAISEDSALNDAQKLSARLKLLEPFTEVCNAIAYAHSKRVIHRDLKPDNVMIGEFGETVVLDWGLARMEGMEDSAATKVMLASASQQTLAMKRSADSSSRLTMAGTVLGTPVYMSPEQAHGRLEEVDELSDVYSLGAILYEIVTGRPPYTGKEASQVLERLETGPPDPILEVCKGAPPELVTLVERAMERDRRRRLPSAKQLAQDVLAFREGRPISVHRYTRWGQAKLLAKRHPDAIRVAAIAIVLLVAGAAYAFWHIDSERDTALEAKASAETAKGESDAALQRAREAEAAERDQRVKAEDARKLAVEQSERANAEAKRAEELTAAAVESARRLRNTQAAGRADAYSSRHCEFLPSGRRALVLTGTRFVVFDLFGNTGMIPVEIGGVGGGITQSFVRTPDFKLIVTASDDGMIRTWRLTEEEDGQTVQILQLDEKPHNETIRRDNNNLHVPGALAVSKDGRTILSGGRDGMIRWWRADAQGKLSLAGIGIGHAGLIRDLDLSRDSKWALSTSRDGTTRLWQLDAAWHATEEVPRVAQVQAFGLRPVDAMEHRVGERKWMSHGCRFLSDGWAYSQTHSVDIRLWRLDLTRTGLIAPSGVFSVTDLPREIESGEAEGLSGDDNPTVCPSGRWMYAGTRGGRVIRLALGLTGTGSLKLDMSDRAHKLAVRGLTLSADGRWLVTTGNDGFIRVWEVDPTAARSMTMRHSAELSLDPLMDLSLSPDRVWLLGHAGGFLQLWRIGLDRRLHLVAAGTGRVHTSVVETIDWHSSGRLAISGGREGLVCLWRIDPMRGHLDPTYQIVACPEGVCCVKLSPDGAWAVAADELGNVRLYRVDVVEGRLEQVAIAKEHGEAAKQIGFSPDGSWFLSSDPSGNLVLWKIERGERPSLRAASRVRATRDGTPEADGENITKIQWLSDGKWVLTPGRGMGRLRLWRVDTSGAGSISLADTGPSEERTLNNSQDVAVSPDGNWCATCGNDNVNNVFEDPDTGPRLMERKFGRVTLWRIDRSAGKIRLAAQGEGHHGFVWSVDWSSDGQFLLTGSHDQTVRLWRVDTNGNGSLDAVDVGRGHRGWAHYVKFAPDGTRAVSAGTDGLLGSWRVVREGKGRLELASLGKSHVLGEAIFEMEMSQDGRWLLTGDSGWEVGLWRLGSDGSVTPTDQR